MSTGQVDLRMAPLGREMAELRATFVGPIDGPIDGPKSNWPMAVLGREYRAGGGSPDGEDRP